MADKNIAIDGDIYEYVAEQAKRNHRTIKGQIAYMIGLIRGSEAQETQVSMPQTDEERAAALRKIR